MHRFPYDVVSSEREGDVTDPSTDVNKGEVLFYPLGGPNKIDSIIIMFFESRSNRQYIRVKNNVLRREANRNQEIIGSFTDLFPSFERIGLTRLIEGHDHDRRTIIHYLS